MRPYSIVAGVWNVFIFLLRIRNKNLGDMNLLASPVAMWQYVARLSHAISFSRLLAE